MVSEKWQHKQLGQLLKLRGGYAFKSEDFHEHGDVAVLRISNIKNNGIDLEDAVYVDRNVAEHAKDYKLREGNVVIAMSGATTGKTAIVRKEDLPLVLNQRVGVFDIYNSEHLSEEYLAYVVQSSSFKNRILVNAIGGAQPNISGKQIEDVEILLPPISEQRKIAAILSSVDEAIEKTEAIIEQTEKVKKGLMQQLLTKGIGHTKFKKTEIGEIPEGWEVVTVEEICDILDGLRRPIKKEDRIPGNIPYYGATGIIDWVNDYIFDEPLVLVGEDGENIRSRVLPMAFKIEGKSWVNNHAHVLRPKNNVHIDYLELYLESLDYEKYITGSAQPKLNQQTLRKIKIALPSKDEQITISNSIQALVSKLKNEKQQLSELEKIKKALMQVLLTGKVRVKVDDEVMSQ